MPGRRSRSSSPQLELYADAGDDQVVQLCSALPAGELPEWIDLVPPGETVRGRDGRQFRNPDPAGVVKAHDQEIPVDEEHATEKAGIFGGPAPAAGWISELRAGPGGGIQGKVAWNATGADLVKGKRYRWISPALIHDRDGRLLKIVSAALTNRPNLRMGALNNRENPMDKRLLTLLGLKDTATADEVVAAVAALHSTQGEHTKQIATLQAQVAAPPLDRFVPKATHDALLTVHATQGAELAQLKANGSSAKIDAIIDAATKAGKIPPAQVDYHRAAAKQPGGLEALEAFVAAAPAVVTHESKVPGTPPPVPGAALSAEQLAVCHALNLAPDDFKLALHNMGAYQAKIASTAKPVGAPGATPSAAK